MKFVILKFGIGDNWGSKYRQMATDLASMAFLIEKRHIVFDHIFRLISSNRATHLVN